MLGWPRPHEFPVSSSMYWEQMCSRTLSFSSNIADCVLWFLNSNIVIIKHLCLFIPEPSALTQHNIQMIGKCLTLRVQGSRFYHWTMCGTQKGFTKSITWVEEELKERHPSGPEWLEQLSPICVLTSMSWTVSMSIHSNMEQSTSIFCLSLSLGFCLYAADSATGAWAVHVCPGPPESEGDDSH